MPEGPTNGPGRVSAAPPDERCHRRAPNPATIHRRASQVPGAQTGDSTSGNANANATNEPIRRGWNRLRALRRNGPTNTIGSGTPERGIRWVIPMGFDRVRRLVRATSSNSAVHVYECRNCGQSLDGSGDECRYCETTTVAEYRIE